MSDTTTRARQKINIFFKLFNFEGGLKIGAHFPPNLLNYNRFCDVESIDYNARMNVAILHGSMGSPAGNWFPWLKQELESLGHAAIVPKFPTPQGQSLASWRSTFDREFGFQNLTATSALIGHSLGAAFALRILCEAPEPIAACFLVAGFMRQLGLPKFDDLNRSFLLDPFDWEQLRSRAGLFIIYSSDNDPYVPLALGEELAGHLQAEHRIVPGGGHLNAEFGFNQFPLLLQDFEKCRFLVGLKPDLGQA